MVIELLDNFEIIREEGDHVAQDLIKMEDKIALYDHIFEENLSVKMKRFFFILRWRPKGADFWIVWDFDIYKLEPYARRRFEKNKNHIIQYGGDYEDVSKEIKEGKATKD